MKIKNTSSALVELLSLFETSLLISNTLSECMFFSLTSLILQLRRIYFYLGYLPARKISKPMKAQ